MTEVEILRKALRTIADAEDVRPVPDREGWTPRFYSCRTCNRRLRAIEPFTHYKDCPHVIAKAALRAAFAAARPGAPEGPEPDA